MMYYYWSRKGIKPSTFFNMPEDEKLVVRAFFELELEEIKQRAEAGVTCPHIL